MNNLHFIVIPAKAGIPTSAARGSDEIPAFAGMTEFGA